MEKIDTSTEAASAFEQAMNQRGWTSRTPLELGRKITFVHKDGSKVSAKLSGIHVTVVYNGIQGSTGHISPMADGTFDEQVERWLSRVVFL